MLKKIPWYLTTNDMVAWYCWDTNLMYLCVPELAYAEHDRAFLDAWYSSLAIKVVNFSKGGRT